MRQALNIAYARAVAQLDQKQRREFDDSLYGFDELNRAGDNVLRDFREADETMTSAGGLGR